MQRGGVEPLCLPMRRKTEQCIFVCMYLKLRIVFVCCLLLPLNLLLLLSHRRLRSDRALLTRHPNIRSVTVCPQCDVEKSIPT